MANPNQNFMSLGDWGQMGSGSYGMPTAYQPPEMFSQPVVPQDWGAALMQGPPASAMGGSPTFPQHGAAGADFSGNWWDGMAGKDGWGGMALGAASGLMQGFLGMKQYGLAKQTLAENRRQFQLNYDAQKQTTNTRLEDRQAARVASNPGAYQSVGAYMGSNGLR